MLVTEVAEVSVLCCVCKPTFPPTAWPLLWKRTVVLPEGCTYVLFQQLARPNRTVCFDVLGMLSEMEFIF